jgi:hypothetical protein
VLEARVGQRSEGIEVRGVVACVKRPPRPGLTQKRPHCGALVGLHGWANLEHLASPPGNEAFGRGAPSDLLELRARLRLVGCFAEVVRKRQALVLDFAADGVSEGRDLRFELVRRGIELEAVVADVAASLEPDQPASLLTGPTAHESDEEIPARQAFELRLCRVRHLGELGSRHDRSQRPVDVEEERASLGSLAERREQVGRHDQENTTVPRELRSRTVYTGIGVAAGFFSALFGVGGGTIVVPLLILLAGFAPIDATGTSLAAIGITALFGMIAFGVLGEVSWADAVVVGLPAMVGALAGIWLQQRVASRLLAGLFSAFLLAIAARLFFE